MVHEGMRRTTVDHVIEDVGGVGAVGEVADLVDDEDVGLDEGRERLAHFAFSAGQREVLDELGGGREKGVEAVLHGTVSDRDREVGLASSWLAFEDDGASFGDEVGGEQRAYGGESEGRLVAEVELLDRAQERKRRGGGRPLRRRAC